MPPSVTSLLPQDVMVSFGRPFLPGGPNSASASLYSSRSRCPASFGSSPKYSAALVSVASCLLQSQSTRQRALCRRFCIVLLSPTAMLPRRCCECAYPSALMPAPSRGRIVRDCRCQRCRPCDQTCDLGLLR